MKIVSESRERLTLRYGLFRFGVGLLIVLTLSAALLSMWRSSPERLPQAVKIIFSVIYAGGIFFALKKLCVIDTCLFDRSTSVVSVASYGFLGKKTTSVPLRDVKEVTTEFKAAGGDGHTTRFSRVHLVLQDGRSIPISGWISTAWNEDARAAIRRFMEPSNK